MDGGRGVRGFANGFWDSWLFGWREKEEVMDR